jgi:transcriptional regulator with XRE-family HTH domain
MFKNITINDLKRELGIWCKQIRKKEGLSQIELAEVLAVSRLTISNLEKGINVNVDTLFCVLKHFDELNALHAFVKEKQANLTIESLY